MAINAKVYYDADADISALEGKMIGVIGYGSQGHAHSLNLKDSGCNVMVGLYQGSKSWEKAEQAGLRVAEVADVAKEVDIMMMTIPDERQGGVFTDHIAENLKSGQTLMFAHGFNIHYKEVVPPSFVDVSMIAPKAPGHRLRELYSEGVGVPALIAIHQDASGSAREVALAYGKGLGCTKAGVLETTFKEETETDLFGEQSVLCGGVTSLIKSAFEILVDAGYQPEVAYFECLHEVKLIVDLIYQGGLEYMRYSVSDTAEYGDYSRGGRIIDDHVRASMKKVLTEIQDGTFAREWIAENREGRTNFDAMRKKDKTHTVEVVGRELREMMSFLNKPT